MVIVRAYSPFNKMFGLNEGGSVAIAEIPLEEDTDVQGLFVLLAAAYPGVNAGKDSLKSSMIVVNGRVVSGRDRMLALVPVGSEVKLMPAYSGG